MREIKVRSFHFGKMSSDNEVNLIQKLESCSDLILMQYTGLTLEDSSQVYEGDILGYENEKNNRFIVYWCGKTLSFKYKYSKLTQEIRSLRGLPLSGFLFKLRGISFLKILGNIHENPEMMR